MTSRTTDQGRERGAEIAAFGRMFLRRPRQYRVLAKDRWIVDKFSYYPAFFLATTIPLLATVSLLSLIRPPQVDSRL